MTTNFLDYLKASATRWPDKVALADDKRSLTFAQWWQLSCSIGTALAEATGQALRQPVLVFVDRRVEGLVGFMGTVASGNFYVPIDSKMPELRVQQICDTLQPIAAITTTSTDAAILESIGFQGIRLDFETAASHPADATTLEKIHNQLIDVDPLYAIFTSGSTGVPKGVVISHRGAIDLAEWLVDTFEFDEHDVLGNQTPFYFDGSVKDLCISVKAGATLRIIGKKYFTFPKLLMNMLNEQHVTTILWATSAILLIGNSNILEDNQPRHLKRIFFAGEAMPAKQLNVWIKHLPDVMYVNLYGPTEITVDCTYYVVDRKFCDDEYIPIGKACRNMQVIVLNESNLPVKPGEPGELCVRGTGVALGYYNNDEKTREAFVQNPAHNCYRDIIYRTGDIVRYNEAGELEFVSRKDFQVKHMGNRIELGEIEVAVNAIQGITQAACIFDREHDKIVLFYATDSGNEIDIINAVKNRLPKYMFPNICIHRATLPLNFNGKIDRQQLTRLYETHHDA